jgi:hypothetical protein
VYFDTIHENIQNLYIFIVYIMSSFRGEKGPQGPRGLDGPIGRTGPSGQTICHYVFPITTTTKDSELPSPYVGVSTATRWNTYRNSSVYPSYIAWNSSTQLEATKLFVSWIDNSGVNVHNFMSMLRRNDIVTIQSKTNHTIKQEWKLNTDPIAHPNFMELNVTLAKPDSVQIVSSDHPHALFIFAYMGTALYDANAAETRIAALEEKVATLTARLASVGIP